MGAAKQQKLERKGRKLGQRSEKGSTPADWMNADPALLQQTIAAMAYTGGALRLGYTRDGGAYAVGVYGDGEPYTLYITPKEDLNAWLTDFIRDVAEQLK